MNFDVASRRWLANALLGLALVSCAVLLRYPPDRFGFYPACPVREYLHFDCPGCGATRALAALLRGHIGEAIRLNGLFVALLPFALAAAVECYLRAVWAEEFRWPKISAQASYAALAAAAAFTVFRNVLA